MAFLAVILLGLVSFSRLPIDLLPDLSYPTLTVLTAYPEAGPAEIEAQVTRRIEEALATMTGVRRLVSTSREGASAVEAEFHWGTPMDFAALEARGRLDNLRPLLPEGAGRPTLIRRDPQARPILVVAVAGQDLLSLAELSRSVLARRLEQIRGVGQVSVTGAPEREVRVEVDPDRLQAAGLSLKDLSAALAEQHYSLAGGTIRQGQFRYPLRVLGELERAEELNDIVVARRKDGSLLRLSEVAQVREAARELTSVARFNGEPSLGLLLYKEAGANTVAVSREVGWVLNELREEFPELDLAVAYDQARFVREAIANVLQAVLLGGLLAFLVLFVFLRDLRSPLAIATVIPVALLGTVAVLHLAGVSLNLMSLGGLALAVGMLVDNSIVVLENIARLRREGRPAGEAAGQGAHEVTLAITASTFTTIAVFLPILYIKGVVGELFQDQALTVAAALLVSLAVALTLLPVLASSRRGAVGTTASTEGLWVPGPLLRALGRGIRGGLRGLRRLAGWLGRPVRRRLEDAHRSLARLRRVLDRLGMSGMAWYEGILERALDHPRAVIWLAALGLAVTAGLGLLLDRELMPEADQGRFEVHLQLPAGTTLRGTDRMAGQVEAWLMKQEGVEAVFTSIGFAPDEAVLTGEEAAEETVRLRVRLKRRGLAGPLMARLRTGASRWAPAQLAVGLEATTLEEILGTGGADLAVRVVGEDLHRAETLAGEVAARLRDVPGLADVRLDAVEGRPQLLLEIDRGAVERHGLTPREVVEAAQRSLRGEVPIELVEFDRRIPVRVRVLEAARDRLDDVLQLPLVRDGQPPIPLGEVVRVKRSQAPRVIHREDQARQVVVLAEVTAGAFTGTVAAVDRALEDLRRETTDLQMLVAGERTAWERSLRSLLLALLLALAMVYMILAAQFESLRQPVLLLFTVPLALFGTLGLLLLTGQSLNLMSGIGMVVMVGVVVNDAIVKVDFINRRRREGLAVRAAIVEAGRLRLRPIVMTTATTVLGLLPMALGVGAGAELRSPLAVAIIGGLLSATALTLIVIPVGYLLMERQKGSRRW